MSEYDDEEDVYQTTAQMGEEKAEYKTMSTEKEGRFTT